MVTFQTQFREFSTEMLGFVSNVINACGLAGKQIPCWVGHHVYRLETLASRGCLLCAFP